MEYKRENKTENTFLYKAIIKGGNYAKKIRKNAGPYFGDDGRCCHFVKLYEWTWIYMDSAYYNVGGDDYMGFLCC